MKRAHAGPSALLESLPPAANKNAEILILGSMPGPASLAAQAYYAHPQNALWPILGAIFGFDANAPYTLRLDALRCRGVALWDVLARCRREGAADATIRAVEVNDFGKFFTAHRQLRRVCFNGGTAARLFRRHVPPAALPRGIELLDLPSTSPAYAAMPRSRKLAHWQTALCDAAPRSTG